MPAIWRFRRLRQALIGCFMLVASLTGCTELPPLPPPVVSLPVSNPGEVPAQRSTTGHVLGPGDVVRVNVYEHADLSQEATIEEDGAFSYPLIGRVQAAGLSVGQLESLLVQRLADGYLVSPQLGVTVTQHKSQNAYVVGAVKAPGVYPLQRQTTLLEMLSAAGGPTADAGFEVILTHAQDKQASSSGAASPSAVAERKPFMRVQLEQLMAGEVVQPIPLRDGDTIYVPPGAFFYVTGEIQRPGKYRLERETTVYKAVTLAGGFTKFAATKTMVVQRVVEGQRLDFQADLNALLQPEDIVVVQPSLF